MPATNGLLENTDSHASQSAEPGREEGRIWSEAEGRVVSERDGGRHGSERKIKVRGPSKVAKGKDRVGGKKSQCLCES